MRGPTAGRSLRPLLRSRTSRPRVKKKGGGRTVLLIVGIVAGSLVVCCAGICVAIFSAIDRKVYSSQAVGPAIEISADSADLPIWSADAAAVARLGSEVVLDRYAIRLPRGYGPFPMDVKPPPKPPGGKSLNWDWVSQPTPRGTRHMISAWLFDVGPAIDPKRFYEAHLPEYLEGIRKSASQVHRTERGKLAGRFTVRVESSLTGTNGVVVNNVDLFWFDGRCLIHLTARAAEADGPEYFDLMKTALLTLHER